MFRVCFFLWVTLASLSSAANSIHSACKNDYATCLEQLPKAIEQTKPQSLLWFRFKLYEIDALYYMQEMQILRQKLDRLAEVDRIPLFLQLKVDVLNAKLYFSSDPQRSLYYQEKAKSAFEEVLQSGENPKLLIDYANLHLYLQQFDKGIHILQRLQDKFAKGRNPEVVSSIAINLGNFYMKKFWYQKAQEQYQVAMNASIGTNLVNSEIVSHYNYARTFQQLKQYELAVEPFIDAQKRAIRGGNMQIVALCDFRLAQIYVQLEQWTLAKMHLEAIEGNSFAGYAATEAKILLPEIIKKLEGNQS